MITNKHHKYLWLEIHPLYLTYRRGWSCKNRGKDDYKDSYSIDVLLLNLFRFKVSHIFCDVHEL